jgi:hypothetical protein
LGRNFTGYIFNSAIGEDQGDSTFARFHRELRAFGLTVLASQRMSPLPLQKTPQG